MHQPELRILFFVHSANFYRQDAANHKLPVLNLLTGPESGFSPRRGDLLHQFKSNLAGPTDTGTLVRLAVKNFA